MSACNDQYSRPEMQIILAALLGLASASLPRHFHEKLSRTRGKPEKAAPQATEPPASVPAEPQPAPSVPAESQEASAAARPQASGMIGRAHMEKNRRPNKFEELHTRHKSRADKAEV